MLLDKIIELATDDSKPVSALLRQCVVLGHQLRNDSLKTWANQELNGYTDFKTVPAYRTVDAGATGLFNAGYAFPTLKRPIPSGLMKTADRWAAETVHLGEP